MAFSAFDFYAVDALLTEEERIVGDTVRAFVEAEVLPHAAKHFREGTFPTYLVPKFGEMGLLGPQL